LTGHITELPELLLVEPPVPDVVADELTISAEAPNLKP
jgi:hypothetical protein